jgi:pimeloyl-ACP methyl ester carboxylesterase
MKRLCSLILAVFAAACSTIQPATKAALTLTPCTLSGVKSEARCGSMEVPERRGIAATRRISLNVAVIPAVGERHPDPIVFLAGGPGQGAAAIAQAIVSQLGDVAAGRDVVLIDQRGTGGSNALSCAGGYDVLLPGNEKALKSCFDQLTLRADLAGYSSAEFVEDIDDVRRALGYRQINIIAGSYGTRPAQMYALAHRPALRSLILRAVTPAGFNILSDAPVIAEKALRETLADCAADNGCHSAFPDLQREYEETTARLRREPVNVPGQTNVRALTLTPELYHYTLYALLLTMQSRQMVPMVIHRAASEGVETMAPITRQITAIYDSISAGAYLSVVCAEDAPRVSPAEAQDIRRLFGGFGAAAYDACSVWRSTPRQPLLPRRIEVPTLLISGASDPATAPEAVEAARANFPLSLHVVAPATAHFPIFPGCVAELSRRFIEQASVAGLDGSCTKQISAPPFQLPAAH